MADVKRLSLAETHETQYCIPNWLRDEQVKLAIARVSGRIGDMYPGLREDPIAVVCYGPSLNDTWEQVKSFTYVISCSGAHKFLLERGIVPTWHCEVDPRAHKVDLLGPPHPDVEYLIASACHPSYFDHLESFNVKLWHIFSNEADAIRLLPRGEWAITGGSSVGLRAMTLSRFLGFTDLHIFGMDGCEGPSGKHAAAHPSQPKDHSITEYKGIEYRTTPSMLECAKQTFHELNQLKDCHATFYGEGLVQALAKDYVPAPAKGDIFIGLNKPEVISAEYASLNAQLHHDNLAYGVGGGKHAPTVIRLVESLKTADCPVPSVLDYGCGKGYLAKALPFPIWEYDPAILEKREPPRPADLVVCTDVLEHIEPDKLFAVLDDLRRCVKQFGFFVIHTGPASKTLPDGRNTHLIQRDAQWWRAKLGKFFTLGLVKQVGLELYVGVSPRRMTVKKKKQSAVAA